MNISFLEKVYLRGLEGLISDKFMNEVVAQEWRNAGQADNALANTFEAKYMAQQVFFQMKGLALK